MFEIIILSEGYIYLEVALCNSTSLFTGRVVSERSESCIVADLINPSLDIEVELTRPIFHLSLGRLASISRTMSLTSTPGFFEFHLFLVCKF